MTCIVGLRHEGAVYIGGDSAGIAGYDVAIRADQKVFRNGPYLMGFTSSFRMGQLLQHSFRPPRVPDTKSLDGFMVTEFVDGVRECLREGGWLSRENEREDGGTFLVGLRGELFTICDDFQVGRTSDGYAAVGCGDALALGSLHTSAAMSPIRRVKAALAAAAHHSAAVAAPFVVRRLAP